MVIVGELVLDSEVEETMMYGEEEEIQAEGAEVGIEEILSKAKRSLHVESPEWERDFLWNFP